MLRTDSQVGADLALTPILTSLKLAGLDGTFCGMAGQPNQICETPEKTHYPGRPVILVAALAINHWGAAR